MRFWQWLGQRDRDYSALRRAGRTAIVMPGLFALGNRVIGNADVATFAAFGSFAMLLLVDFGGPLAARVQAQVALALAGGVLVCLGTLASQVTWLAAAAMAVVAFAVLFAGVISSMLASATTALLLAFILPVSVTAPVSAIPARLAGWAMAGAAAVIASALAWPAPVREPLRAAAGAACQALAARLRAEVAYLRSGGDQQLAEDRDQAVARAGEAAGSLHRAFLATPYRASALATSARTIVRLVAEVDWVNTITSHPVRPAAAMAISHPARAVKLACAAVLERGADLLSVTAGDGERLRGALGELAGTLASLEERTADRLPDANGSWQATGSGRGAGAAAAPGPGLGSQPGPDGQAGRLISALDPAFRAQELGFAVSLIGQNIALAAAAERRSWTQRVLGRQPAGAGGILSAAQARAAAHADPHSVWLRNSLRGAAGLGLAVLLARLTGVQHSFWVVLGTLSVLRSNALSTGQDALRALAGTVAGLAAGAGLLELMGTNQTALWFVLPVVVLLAGVAPAAISFAAGQAAFTLTLVILFNIIKPAGWKVGLFRLEDIALGCAVSLAVGLLFWPRGASSVLRQALADAYADGAAYLANAVEAGIDRCTAGPAGPRAPAGPAGPAGQAAAAVRASAAARRLDDAFRAYLAERGPKRIPLADVTSLITGASGLRLAADAVRHLWEHDPGRAAGERAAARREILAAAARVRAWYDGLANSLVSGQDLGDPLGYDQVADGRLIEAVRRDLHGGADEAATAVRIIWTGDHLDAARRLQATIGPAAHAALAARR